jgi:hypothetical protein
MTLPRFDGMIGAAPAARRDAKLALVMPQADPLALPSWGPTLLIENQRRLASAILCGPRAAAVAVSRRLPATRGA